MVDTIDLQKIFPPISSTAKVKHVKQRHTNMQERKFAQHLQAEGKKERKQDKEPGKREEAEQKNESAKDLSGTASDGCQGSPDDVKSDDTTTGKLIDILA